MNRDKCQEQRDDTTLAVPDAEEVVLKVRNVNWELFDASYREYHDRPDASEHTEWLKKKEMFLGSASRRAKFRALMGEVVAVGHVGNLSYDVVYDRKWQQNLEYTVVSTRPEGEVRIAEKTKLYLT